MDTWTCPACQAPVTASVSPRACPVCGAVMASSTTSPGAAALPPIAPPPGPAPAPRNVAILILLSIATLGAAYWFWTARFGDEHRRAFGLPSSRGVSRALRILGVLFSLVLSVLVVMFFLMFAWAFSTAYDDALQGGMDPPWRNLMSFWVMTGVLSLVQLVLGILTILHLMPVWTPLEHLQRARGTPVFAGSLGLALHSISQFVATPVFPLVVLGIAQYDADRAWQAAPVD